MLHIPSLFLLLPVNIACIFIICLFPRDIEILSGVLVIMNEATMNISVCLCVFILFHFLWVKYIGMELLSKCTVNFM